jgi:hypothetical protein
MSRLAAAVMPKAVDVAHNSRLRGSPHRASGRCLCCIGLQTRKKATYQSLLGLETHGTQILAAGVRSSSGRLAGCGTSLPPQDAATADRRKPRLFDRSAQWTKAMDAILFGTGFAHYTPRAVGKIGRLAPWALIVDSARHDSRKRGHLRA